MQTIVIFDGPDGCGKTNIATELSKLVCIPYFKNRTEWTAFEKFDDYFVNAIRYADPYFISYLEQSRASVILDRAFPSEWVYSQAFGRATDFKQLIFSDRAYAALGTRIVIPVRSSYDHVRDQFSQIDAEKLREIDKLYRAFAEWTKCKTLFLNVDSENVVEQVGQIAMFMMESR